MTDRLDPARTVSSGEAVRLLGVSQTRVGVLVKSGQIRAIETPLGRLIDRRDVERLAARRAAQQQGEPLPADRTGDPLAAA